MTLRTGLGLAMGLVCGATSAYAAPATFFIDPAQSTLTLAGSALAEGGNPPSGVPFTAQGEGALLTTLTGSVTADISAGEIAFTGGAFVLGNSGSWLPGDEPANFGFHADGVIDPIGVLDGAMRGAAFAPVLPATATSANGAGFDFAVDAFALTGTAGSIAFSATPQASLLGALDGVEAPLAGLASTGTLAPLPPGTFTSGGNTEVLTIPLRVYFADFVIGSDVDWQLEGTVVATRVVPEPATFALLGSVMLLARPCRSARRRARSSAR